MGACKEPSSKKVIVRKRGQERFLKTAKELLAFEIKNVSLSPKFSKKARSHMISCHILDNQQPEPMNSYGLIEKIRQCYTQSKKCHRSIDDSKRKHADDLIDKRSEL